MSRTLEAFVPCDQEMRNRDRSRKKSKHASAALEKLIREGL